MKTTFIYALCEPDGKIRYVGKSNNPKWRFSAHLSGSINQNTRLGHWLNSLISRGERPLLEVLDEVPDSQWQFWEREYIRVFRAVGMTLVNGTEGGDGVTMTPEIRAKMSGTNHPMFGKHHSPEARRKMSGPRFLTETTRKIMSVKASASLTGRPVSKATRIKQSESQLNLSPEIRAKRAANTAELNRKRIYSPKTREKLSFAARNRSSETRSKLSLAMKASWALRKEKNNAL